MVPDLADVLAVTTAFALPMRRQFRGVDLREGVLIHGPSGWGEWAPFPEYGDDVAAVWLAGALEAAFGSWPAPVRDRIPVNAIIPGTGAQDAYAMTCAAVRETGCTTVKVKVGERGAGLSTISQDVARVSAVHAALVDCGVRAQGAIRIDANTVWTLDEATEALTLLDDAAGGLDYAEQPCATLVELAALRTRVSVRIAADESIRTADDPMRAAAEGAIDLIVVKATPLGGVQRALDVVAAAGVPCVVSGALDSAVGLAAGIALAAALPTLDGACGLGTGALLAADVVRTPLVPTDGSLPVGRIAPDAEALAAATDRMSRDRATWWFERLHRAYAHLGQSTALGSQRG